jgi:hypothetical protein
LTFNDNFYKFSFIMIKLKEKLLAYDTDHNINTIYPLNIKNINNCLMIFTHTRLEGFISEKNQQSHCTIICNCFAIERKCLFSKRKENNEKLN